MLSALACVVRALGSHRGWVFNFVDPAYCRTCSLSCFRLLSDLGVGFYEEIRIGEAAVGGI